MRKDLTVDYQFNPKPYIPPQEDPVIITSLSRVSRAAQLSSLARWNDRLRVLLPKKQTSIHYTSIGGTKIQTRSSEERRAGATGPTLRINYAVTDDSLILGDAAIYATVTLYPPFSTLEDFGPNWDRIHAEYGGDIDRFVSDPDNVSRNFATEAATLRHELMHVNALMDAARRVLWERYRDKLRQLESELRLGSGPQRADEIRKAFESLTKDVWDGWGVEGDKIISHEQIHQAELRGIVEQYMACCIRKAYP